MLKQAVRWNMIVRNPCDEVTLPVRGRVEITALDEHQVIALIDGLRGTSLGAPVHFTVLTALWRSKLLGLNGKTSILNRIVNVRRGVEQVKGGVLAFKDTKTFKSRRQVPLALKAVDVLTAHRAAQNAIKLRPGGHFKLYRAWPLQTVPARAL